MREGGAGGKGRAPGLCLTPNLLCARDTKETITDKGDPPTSETPEMLTFQLGGSDRKLFSHFVSSRLNSGTECTPSSPTAHTCPFFLGRPSPPPTPSAVRPLRLGRSPELLPTPWAGPLSCRLPNSSHRFRSEGAKSSREPHGEEGPRTAAAPGEAPGGRRPGCAGAASFYCMNVNTVEANNTAKWL